MRIIRWGPLATIAAGGLIACGSPEAPARTQTAADTSLQLLLPQSSLEPLESMTATITLVYPGGSRPVTSDLVTWTSSDSTIATIDGGLIVGRREGRAEIGATAGGRFASLTVTVQWRRDAKLTVTVPAETISVGARFQTQALVRNQRRVHAEGWTSSDARIASVDSLGIVTALAVGRVTISATFDNLQGSVTFDVAPSLAGQGFGYLYSYAAPVVDDYDSVSVWDPPPGLGYSTASGPRLYFSPPYPSTLGFGWLGAGTPQPAAVLHIVPYDVTPCAAYNEDRVDLNWILVGTPVAECYNRQSYRSSYRMEFIAADPGAFDGTLALVRPQFAPMMSNGAPIREIDAGIGVRDYEAAGLVRDSLYWFVSPARSELGTCSLLPAGATPSSAMARVVCRTSEGTGVEPVIYGIGFGTDAARGTNPRAFAELDSLGRIIRTSTRGLDISAVRLTDQPSPVFDISVSGEQLAAFDRLPAVYLTAVSTNAPACMMSASAELPSRVLLHVRCLGPVDGLLVGVLY